MLAEMKVARLVAKMVGYSVVAKVVLRAVE
jgi:hypothetical protein